jgi:hypothetical protein
MRRFFKLSTVLAGVACATVLASAQAAEDQLTFVRITPEQYERTIHDIFGSSIKLDANAVETGFRDQGLLAVGARKLAMTSAGLEQFEQLAQQVAFQVVDPKRNATLVHCQPKAADGPDEACASQFLDRVGLLVLRRPLKAEEKKELLGTANAAATKLKSFNTGVAAALVQMLVNPEFLFRIERSEADPNNPGKARLDGYSVASRLSFFIWDSTPDAELLEAARSGKLQTPKGLAQQVDRMLNSPRAENGLRAFFSDMLGFDGFDILVKDTNLFPKFTKNAEDEAREQTLRTLVDQLLERNADYRDMYTTRETFLTPSLAALYGVPLPRSQEMGGATPWVPYKFPENDSHIGILTHASFLALHSHPGKTSPTVRGKALRENILCQKVPAPPGNVDFTLIQDVHNPNLKTVRQRLLAHATSPACAGCHKITDPIGLSFEHFDTAAAYRENENGAEIDVTGALNGKDFNGVTQLSNLLRNEPAVTSCLINRVFSYGTARVPTPAERKWLTAMQADLTKKGVKWREVVRGVATNPDFYTVTAPVAEQKSASAN